MAQPDSELFATIVETRNVELTMHWTRFNIYLLVNGGLLIAVLTANSSKLDSLGRAPYWFGLVFSILWFISESAGRLSLHHRDRQIEAFQEKFWKTQHKRITHSLELFPSVFASRCLSPLD